MIQDAIIFVLLLVLFVLFWGAIFLGVCVLIYNRLIQSRNRCDESWADIEAELKRRYDLIPNLVHTVQGYAKHEREVLEGVSQARTTAMANHGPPQSQASDENELIRGLRQLFAVVENYPDLKANQNFLSLQTELAISEDRIQRARRFYNANVREYQDRLQIFPSNLVARRFDFPNREFFEIESVSQQQQVPVVKLK
jgi:LemA protein